MAGVPFLQKRGLRVFGYFLDNIVGLLQRRERSDVEVPLGTVFDVLLYVTHSLVSSLKT